MADIEATLESTPIEIGATAESTPIEIGTTAESTPIEIGTTAESTPIEIGTTVESTPILITATIGTVGEGGGDLLAANNLSDVDSAPTSLANLGGLPLAGGTLTGGVTLPAGAALLSTNGDAALNISDAGETIAFATGADSAVIGGEGDTQITVDTAAPEICFHISDTERLLVTAAGAAITGDITVTGLVDGRDVAADAPAVMGEADWVMWGDSLTYGALDTGGAADRPIPETLSTMLGVPVVNKGISGYIPRHRVYKALIDDAPTVLLADIKSIPPSELENRINQDGGVHDGITVTNIEDGPRTFYSDGQVKWVHRGTPSEATARKYTYTAASTATADDDGVLTAAGGTGRWIETTGVTFAPTTDNNVLNANIIFWLGANGMESADVISAARMLQRNRGPRQGAMVFCTLPNRLPPSHNEIPWWATITAECNSALETTFPGAVIDVAGFVMQGGHAGTLDYYHPIDANDDADIAEGIVPRSLKLGTVSTYAHFSQDGYTEIARYIARELYRRGLVRRISEPLPIAGLIRYWPAAGLMSVGADGNVRSLSGTTNAAAATALTIAQGGTGPSRVFVGNGAQMLSFDGTGTQRLGNDFSNQGTPNTVFWAGRCANWEDARVDLTDGGTGNTARHALSINAGKWSMLRGSFADSTVDASGDWVVLIGAFDGASSAMWVNGVKTAALDPGAGNFNAIYLPGSVGDFEGEVYACGYVDGFISDADATALTNAILADLPANDAAGDLLAANNLSDVGSAATTRTNLGLGTAATTASGDYATAAHNHAASEITSGTLADARVAESNVTQHEAAINIDESQINDIPANVDAGEIAAGTETAVRRYAPADIKSFVDTHSAAVASQSEVDAGTDSAKLVTPETLKGYSRQTNNQTGTTYTLALTDANEVVEFNNAAAITATVPPNSTVAFPIGSEVELWQQGAGQVTVAAGAGVTIRSADADLKLRAQYSGAVLRKRGTDEWVLVGDIDA